MLILLAQLTNCVMAGEIFFTFCGRMWNKLNELSSVFVLIVCATDVGTGIASRDCRILMRTVVQNQV